MSITTVESIAINGSQNFLGGQIYNLRFGRGFNGSSSTIEANIVAESKNYQIPDLNYTSPYHISLGGIYNFDMFASRYCISDGQNGRLLSVFFEDNIRKLRVNWIAPVGQVCAHPNVIFCGSVPNGNAFGSVNQAQGVVQTSSFSSSPTSSFTDSFALRGVKDVPFGSYNYAEFQAKTAFLGIPSIQSNNLVRITQEGTVLDIFNHFMNLYGYSWYLDAETIKLIDIKKPLNIDGSLIASMEAHPRRLSSNMCVDISNNYVKGAVALDDGQNDDPNDPNSGSFVLSAATALWDGTDISTSLEGNILLEKDSNVKILDVPILGGYGPKAAMYALFSPQLYFAYIHNKYGVDAAVQAMGYQTYTNQTLDKLTGELKDNQVGSSSSPFNTEQSQKVKVLVSTNVSNAGIKSFYERDKQLGEILKQGYYVVKDINASVQWAEGNPILLNPDMKFSEIPQFAGLISNNTTIKSKTTQFVWLLSFPVEPDFSSFENNKTFLEQINSTYLKVIPFNAGTVDSQFSDSKYEIIRVDTNGAPQAAFNMPNLTFSSSRRQTNYSSIRYVKGDLNVKDIRIGNVTQKDIPIYGLAGRKIIACNVPAVKPETSNLEIVTFENLQDQVPNVKSFIAQNTYSRNNSDIEYEWVIRGITHGLDVTPEKGLDNISISLDENGYTTSYHFSSKREVPPEPEALKSILQFSTIT